MDVSLTEDSTDTFALSYNMPHDLWLPVATFAQLIVYWLADKSFRPQESRKGLKKQCSPFSIIKELFPRYLRLPDPVDT